TFVCPNFAQYTTVNYDFERNWFNEGQPLPSEANMVIKGMVPTETQMVELVLLSAKSSDPLYTATWKKTNSNEMALITPFKLRASSEYDAMVKLYSELSSAKQSELKQNLLQTLKAYMDVNMYGDKSIKLRKNSKKTLRELNELLEAALSQYRNTTAGWTPEFSEIVRLKLEQIENADLAKAYDKNQKAEQNKAAVRAATRTQLIEDLHQQLEREVTQMFDTDLLVLSDTRFVDNYATERKQNSIAFNVGYGGVYLSGNWDDFTYGASPYLGLAFPLGNSVLGSKFLSNTSVTLGVFLENFEDQNGNEVTGLIVNRPIYLGLDHKLFKFIRINAGASFLEGMKMPENVGDALTKQIMVRPYVGLSARIDLSVNLGR
ncbi:MAG: hypothetical protein AAFO94_19800, partial [Bacteroidota bacterium]